LRRGLRALLNEYTDLAVVGEAASGDQALEQVRLNKPDVLLLDISMPGTGGVEAAAEVRRLSPHTRVVILTMHTERAYLNSAIAAGASGYVLKSSLDSDLVSAIRAAHEGKTFIDSGVAGHLIDKALGQDGARQDTVKEAYGLLSRREQQVLKLVAEGNTNQEIASEACISVKSVESYRARLLKKLRIGSKRELVRFAIEAGLLSRRAPISDSR
jgi:two-component system, NarL family, response regulator NreC